MHYLLELWKLIYWRMPHKKTSRAENEISKYYEKSASGSVVVDALYYKL
jgi:hypothetical protein